MKVAPYLHFNGDCAQALALYEKAFGAKAETMRYSDAPPSEGYAPPPGTEDFIMHAQIEVDGAQLMFCDVTPDMQMSFGNGIAIHVLLGSEAGIKAAFDAMKEDGKVDMEPQETFWSKCFGSLQDKFGVSWMLSLGCPDA